MSHTHRIYFSVAALLFASLACASMPVFSTPDTGAISTSVAQTVIAGFDTECAAGNFISHA